MNYDPDTRNRHVTARLVKSLLTEYYIETQSNVEVGKQFKNNDEDQRFDKCSWSAVTPRSGGGMQLQIGTQSYGCIHFRRDSVGCLNCGLPTMSLSRVPSINEMVSQVSSALEANCDKLDGLSHISLQGDGSFLSPTEVPKEVVYAVAEYLKRIPGVHTVTMETRLDLLSLDFQHISRVRSILAPEKRLEIAVGLESASEFIRNIVFRKGASHKYNTKELLLRLADCDIDVLLYVFVKPVLLTEAEAIFDAVRTLNFVQAIASYAPNVHWTAALQPSFVQADTFLEWQYKKGSFIPPSLWSIVEIIKRGVKGPATIHLGSPNDYPQPLSVAANRKSDGYICECSESFYSVLLNYNKHGSTNQLIEELPLCECKSTWGSEVHVEALTKALDNLDGFSIIRRA